MENEATEQTVKTKKKPYIIIIIAAVLGVILLIGLVFAVGYFTTPFQSQYKVQKVYIIKGEQAKGSINFMNKANSNKTLVVNFGKYGTIKKGFLASKSGSIDYNFGAIENDMNIVGKYGFMNLKKIIVHVTVVDSSQIVTDDIQIFDAGTDLTKKKYAAPGKTITFKLDVTNNSQKEFERDYPLLINNKEVATETAKWSNKDTKATLTYTYTFDKQGYYDVDIGGKKIKFISAKKDKAPSNGTILKSATGGSGVFELTNKYKHDVIVTIADSITNKSYAKVFIKAGKKATINNVKDGKYVMYVKGGSAYSSMIKDFLDVNVSYKFNSILKFQTTSTTYTIWKISLGVTGGNLKATDIDDDSIPE